MAEGADLVLRSRRWIAWGVAVAAVLYVVGSVVAGVTSVGDALAGFQWRWYVPVLLLTIVNYGLRGWKWGYLLHRLGVHVPWRDNLLIFVSGLAMVISPGKAGELLKPYLVRASTGAPMARTIPALVTERLTDGIAALALAAIGVSRYAGDRAVYVYVPIVLTVLGLLVLSHERLSLAILHGMGRLPLVDRISGKLIEMYQSMRICVAPVPLFVTVAVSLVAWGAECIGYQLVFIGFGRDAPLGAATFLYAFATIAGGAMPGGLGVADGALVVGAVQLFPGCGQGEALAASLLIRVATLWFGVILGAFALLRVGRLLTGPDRNEGSGRET